MATSNIYYTGWCNVTDNQENYNSSDGNVIIRLESIKDKDQGTLKEEFVQYYDSYENQVNNLEDHFVKVLGESNPPGYLEVSLIEPPISLTLAKYQNFTINATVYCRGGVCGNVNGTLRYNQTSMYPDSSVSTIENAQPFYVQEIDPASMKACSNNPLNEDDFCSIIWK